MSKRVTDKEFVETFAALMGARLVWAMRHVELYAPEGMEWIYRCPQLYQNEPSDRILITNFSFSSASKKEYRAKAWRRLAKAIKAGIRPLG